MKGVHIKTLVLISEMIFNLFKRDAEQGEDLEGVMRSKKRPEEASAELKEYVAWLIEREAGESATEGGNLFSFEASARKHSDQLELEFLKHKIEKLDRGYEGNTRRCPKCGKLQQLYKGDQSRIAKFESGDLEIMRSCYHCDECKETNYPLDDKLSLVSGEEQGHLREKLTMLATITSYNQAAQVCKTLVGREESACALRNILLRESERIADVVVQKPELPTTCDDTVYLQIDGHMCPTREKRRDSSDQGYREAKAVLSFRAQDVAEVSKDRREILDQLIEAEIISADKFKSVVQDVYNRSNAERAKALVALADGAPWIWNIIEDVAPEAVQILDYSHMKSYLYQAAELIYLSGSDLIKPWVKQQENLLFDDNVSEVIENMRRYIDLAPPLRQIISYFETHKHRMAYGSFSKRGFNIGSGSIESAGKRIAQGRVKGSGMRWNIRHLNPLLRLRCSLIDQSWHTIWLENFRKAA